MTNDSTIEIPLAGGGDERIAASRLTYIRRILDSEAEREPEGASAAFFGNISLVSSTSATDLADAFARHISLVVLSARDSSLVYVNGASVQDVDDVPSTLPGAVSWLVFGSLAGAPRLAVRQNRDQLRNAWTAAGLDPNDSGI